jgi:hypothetical protein
VIPFGSDLSRAPSCACAIAGNITAGNRTLKSAIRERMNGDVNFGGLDRNLITLF